jgi:hypothetical protein
MPQRHFTTASRVRWPAAPIFTCYRGKGDLRPMQEVLMEKGGPGSPPFVAFSSSVTTCNQRRNKIAANPQFPNFTIVLRVNVELPVTTAGPPLKKCQAEYCSMYGSSDDRQSIGTITL